jgi:hypothetical protein
VCPALLQVGYWVATEIVQAKTLKEQLGIVKKFIQVASGTLHLCTNALVWSC